MNIKLIFKRIWSYLRRADIIFWLIMIAISIYSLLLLKSVSRATQADYFKTQLVITVIGFLAAIFITFIDYLNICNFWYLIAGFSFALMVYTILFGETVSGSGGVSATAWIIIGGRTFQSSELVKIAFILTYSKHLDTLQKKNLINDPKQVFFLALHALIPVLLCSLQGDDGAGIVFFAMFIFMSLSAGIKLRYFAALAGVATASIPILWNFVLRDYQKLRFSAVYNLDDPRIALDEGYQQFQGRISIGSGKIFGEGLFNGGRVATNSVTFQQSDFIFSVAGEELGLIGCLLIILLLLIYMLKILHVASSSRDVLGKYICFGFFGLIALQTVSNIGMCLAILPVMGVTLPFFSAGGSSAVCLYLGFGLVQSVYMRRQESDGVRLKRNTPLLRFGKKLK